MGRGAGRGGSKHKEEEKPRCDSNIFQLAGNNMLNEIKKLVEREEDEKAHPPVPPPVSVSEVDENGCTPLVWAARAGFLEIIDYLLDKGATTEAPGYGGMYPLHHTCNMMQEPAMTLLLERGAAVDSQDDNGNTSLTMIVGRGNLSMAAKLMEAGADLNHKNKTGCTPLMKAASNGRLVVVQKLVSSKVDLDAVDSEGNTAVHLAAGCTFNSIVQLLIKTGATMDKENKMGQKPLDLAMFGPHPDHALVEMLTPAP
jgi:ankyrin repeat protein